MKLTGNIFVALSAATIASGDVILDQIGPDDGSMVGTNITGCQDFEAAYDIYDIATLDNFTGAGETINMVEMCLNGWNGFVSPDSVIGYTANLHSDPAAAALDLMGDIGSSYVDAADATLSATWMGAGFVISMPAEMTSANGANWVSMIPSNDFATGGQTGCADTLMGDGTLGWQANPGGGFGMPGNMQQMTGEAAYRVHSGAPLDPCDSPLPTECTADVNGDMIISVTDVLAVIGSWGECGDGTFRPVGDVAPMPNGDCCVNVSDVLAVIGSWGEDCTPMGACCSDAGDCSDGMSQVDCESVGGNYEGDDTSCADIICAVPYSGCPDGADSDCDDCWVDGNDSTTDCNPGLNGNGDMDPLTIGVPLCGESSVFVDVSGDTFRDTDWFSCNALNAGGNFSITCETEGVTTIFGIIDIDKVVFVQNIVVEPGQIIEHDFAPLAPGNYCFWAGASEWNTDWSCANGANYWLQLDAGAAATGACCVGEVCVAEVSMDACAAKNGTWHFDSPCEDVNNCLPMIGSCCVSVDVCLDDMTEEDCNTFGGTFRGIGSSCAKIDCGNLPCQYPHGVDDAWSAGTSTDDPTNSVYYNRAELVNKDSMSTMTIWGLQLYFSDSWGTCTTDFGFNVRAYDDSGSGTPGTVTAESLDVPATKVATGELFAGLYELMEWNMDFSATNVDWIAAQSASDGLDCWFLWISSDTGDGVSAFDDGTGWASYAFDLAVCVE